MPCLDEDRVLDLIDGRLDPEETGAIERHRDSCSRCAELLSIYEYASPNYDVAAPLLRTGARLGRYELGAFLGAGGMGLVFSAYDPQLDRTLALKLLRPSLAVAEGARERLRHEARVMARLSHPNVVSVFEVADDDAEHLFLAMELVDGVDLRTWLAERPRRWQEVAAAFLEAGRGLAAAHDAGIVHRDFKPANVLVGHDGRVRVTDFGLASLRGGPAAGGVAGTPAYMAPEQRAGAAPSAAADQYSFCASLNEALAGSLPGRGGAGRAPGDVARVLARGTRPQPNRRYPTLHALLGDLSACLSRRRRRVRRAGFALAGAVCVAGGFAAALAARPDPAAAVSPCSDSTLGQAWNPERRAALQGALVGTGASYAGATAAEVLSRLDAYAVAWITEERDSCEATRVGKTQSDSEFDDRVRCLGLLRHELETVVDELSTKPHLLDRAVAAVTGLRPPRDCARRIPAAGPQVSEIDRERLERGLATASAMHLTANYARAEEIAADLAREAEELGDRYVRAAALYRMGAARVGAGRAAEAEEILMEALELAAAIEADYLAADAWIELVAAVGLWQARHEEAMRLARLAEVAITRARSPAVQRALLHHTVGALHLERGEFGQAVEMHREALALRERIYGTESVPVAQSLGRLGFALRAAGDVAGAVETLERAASLSEALLGDGHPQVASILQDLGGARRAGGDLDRAISDLLRSHAITEEVFGRTDMELGRSHYGLCGAYLAAWDLARALDHCEHARAVFEAALGPDHPRLGSVLNQLASVHHDAGNASTAEALYRRALAIRETADPDHPYVATSLTNLGTLYLDTGDLTRGERMLSRALDHIQRTFPDGHPRRAVGHNNLGEVLLALGEVARARRHFSRGGEIARLAGGDDSLDHGYSLTGLGECALAQGDPVGSIDPLEQALAIAAENHDQELLARTQFALARSLGAARRDPERARELARSARGLYLELLPRPGADDRVRRIDAWLARRAPGAR